MERYIGKAYLRSSTQRNYYISLFDFGLHVAFISLSYNILGHFKDTDRPHMFPCYICMILQFLFIRLPSPSPPPPPPHGYSTVVSDNHATAKFLTTAVEKIDEFSRRKPDNSLGQMMGGSKGGGGDEGTERMEIHEALPEILFGFSSFTDCGQLEFCAFSLLGSCPCITVTDGTIEPQYLQRVPVRTLNIR